MKNEFYMNSETPLNKKIILIEDDEYLGRVYERVFKHAEFEVTIVSDGEQALKLLPSVDPLPAVIILDILIPKVNGYDVLVAIRKDNRYNMVPVVVLTNSFTENEDEKFRAAGADAYLIKINNQPNEVVEKVLAVITNTHRA